jgi:outer membrane lipoprotein-sorting protein
MTHRPTFLALALLVTTGVAASCAAQQPSSAEPGPSARDALPDAALPTGELLERMHHLGQTLSSLRADVEMQTDDAQTGNLSIRSGTFLLERRPDGDSRARVVFDKLINDDGMQRKIINEKVEYLLDGDWVIDRVYGRSPNDPAGRRETHRQIRKPGEKVDLLQLGQGPFPLPIGQSPDSVRQQFEVTRLPDDPEKPNLIGLELRPREQTRLARQFHQIVIWVDQADAMPRVIETVSAENFVDPQTGKPELVAGTESKTTVLSEVKINAPVAEADFKLEPIDQSTWTIVTQEYRE